MQKYLELLPAAIMAMVVLHAAVNYFSRRPVRPAGPFRSPWRPLESISIFLSSMLISAVVSLIVLELVYATLGGTVSPGPQGAAAVPERFLQTLLPYGVNVFIIYHFLRRRQASPQSWGWRRFRWHDIGLAFGSLIVYYFLLKQIVTRLLPLDYGQQQQLGFDTAQTGPALLLIFISLVILPPLVEEFIFRGFLYSGLRSRCSRLTAALVVAGLFALAHLDFGGSEPLHWALAADTFLLSFFLVGLREATGGLIAPIAMHAMKNGIAFYVLFIYRAI